MLRLPSRFAMRACAFGAVVLLLSGCEIPGVYPDPKVAQREADAKATGGGCRHAQRGLEDCYTLNPKAPRSAVFAGWKDMDQYMRENKIEGTRSSVTPAPPATEEQSVASGRDKTASDPKDRRGGREKAS